MAWLFGLRNSSVFSGRNEIVAGSSEHSANDSKVNYFSGETGRVHILHQVKCSRCGGAVDISGGQELATCQYCGYQFAVDVPNPDFVINRGVLTEYRGTGPEVIVPDYVTAVGPAAFVSQDLLIKIILPNEVRELQGGAFRDCRRLETLVLSDNLEAIPDCAFSGCESLSQITLPRNLKFLGRMVFDGCKSLVSIEIPPGVRVVEKDIFSNCANLETIVLGENTELRGNLLEESCPKLSTIVILDPCTGEKVAEKRVAPDIIGYYTETIVWEMSSGERAELARRAAERIQSQPEESPAAAPAASSDVSVPSTEQGFPSAAPQGRPGEQTAEADGINKLYCSGCGGAVNITEGQVQATCPFCGLTFTVTFESAEFVIDQGVLVKYAGEGLEVTVPEGVRVIGMLAFYGQSSLTKIVLPDSVKELQGGFMGCRSLETLILSNNIESIPDAAFHDCESLKTIVLPRNLRFLGNMAFLNCSSLTSVEIPPRVKSLDKMAFYNCAKLETITRYKSTALTGRSFVMCPKLKKFPVLEDIILEEIPGPVESQPVSSADPFAAADPFDAAMGEQDQHIWPRDIRCSSCNGIIHLTNAQALVNCEYCGSQFSINVDNPDFIIDQGVLVKYIGISREVVVPEAASAIGTLAFYQQNSLKKIVLPNSVTELQGAFIGCFDLETLVLSDNIQTIPAAAFKDCVSLTSITLPANLRTIESMAFTNCKSLTKVELPKALASLGDFVFFGCESFDTIVSYKGTKLSASAFSGCRRFIKSIILDPATGAKLSEKKVISR